MKTIYGKVEAGTQTMQATGGGIDEIQTDLARFQVGAIRQLGRTSTRSRRTDAVVPLCIVLAG
jgi:hypothetical protein